MLEDRVLDQFEDPEDRGIVVGVIAYSNQRWATERLEPADAAKVALNRAALVAVTGRERSRAGLARLRHAFRKTSARVSQEDGYVLVDWPKLAELQSWGARVSPDDDPKDAPSAHAHAHAHEEEGEKGFGKQPSSEPSGSGKGRQSKRSAGQTDPPNELTTDLAKHIEGWARDVLADSFEGAWSRLQADAEACLAWYRGKGRRQSDWKSTLEVWLRKNENEHRARQNPPLPPLKSRAEMQRLKRSIERAKRAPPDANGSAHRDTLPLAELTDQELLG